VSSIGLQILMVPLAGLHLAMTYHEVADALEIVRALGNSYRLASLEPGSSALYGRFTFNFCRAVVAVVGR
jgi:hypothetical protein